MSDDAKQVRDARFISSALMQGTDAEFDVVSSGPSREPRPGVFQPGMAHFDTHHLDTHHLDTHHLDTHHWD